MAKELLITGMTALVLLAAGSAPAQQRALTVNELPIGEVIVYGQVISARMAVTPEHRATGFQGASPEAVAHEIVYFRFDMPGQPGFDTHGIPVPLLTAWIGLDDRIVAVEVLQPASDERRPPAPIIAALQVGPLNPLANTLRAGITVRPVGPLGRGIWSASHAPCRQ